MELRYWFQNHLSTRKPEAPNTILLTPTHAHTYCNMEALHLVLKYIVGYKHLNTHIDEIVPYLF